MYDQISHTTPLQTPHRPAFQALNSQKHMSFFCLVQKTKPLTASQVPGEYSQAPLSSVEKLTRVKTKGV